jgi:hypothetical protein
LWTVAVLTRRAAATSRTVSISPGVGATTRGRGVPCPGVRRRLACHRTRRPVHQGCTKTFANRCYPRHARRRTPACKYASETVAMARHSAAASALASARQRGSQLTEHCSIKS